MNQTKQLGFLDGIKVICCFWVFNFHIVNLFYPGEYSLLEEYYHVPAVEYFIGTTPLNLFLCGGKLAVRMFLAMSGFFVGYRFFTTGEKKSLLSGAVKKYFRLVFPIAVVGIAVYLLMAAGVYFNGKASVLANSEPFFGNYNAFEPSIWGALKESFISCFLWGDNKYNGPVWFIFFEFFGTVFMAVFLWLFGEKKLRYILYVVLCVAICAVSTFVNSFYFDFLPLVLGTVVCDVTYKEPKWLGVLSKQKWLMVIMLLVGLFLGSFPPIGTRLEGTMFQFFPVKVLFYYSFATAMILYSLLHLDGIAKFLDIRPLTWFTKYTYCFYLLHFPVLCTFTSGVFVELYPKMNYHVLVLIDVLLTVVLIFILSILLRRYVENPGVKFANWFGKKVIK